MTPAKRKKRLKELLRRMKAGHDVAQRDLKIVLTETEYLSLNERWRDQQKLCAKGKPWEIKEYERFLNKALFLDNKAESYSAKKVQKRDALGKRYATKFYNAAEAAYEHALEHLCDILSGEPTLQIWLDRIVDFCANGSNIDIHSEGMPRVVTSRSSNKLGSGIMGKRTKREFKQDALESALSDIREETKRRKRGVTQAQKERMKRMLERVRQRSSI